MFDDDQLFLFVGQFGALNDQEEKNPIKEN